MNGEARNVTVGAVVQAADAAGFSLDVVAGEAGLERLITIPYPQKTGLALAGFDASLQPGRMLVFGESELRYLAALETPVRVEVIARVLARGVPCIVISKQQSVPPEPDRAGRSPAGADHAYEPADAAGDREAHEPARRSARAARELSRRAARHSRPRRADHRRERHRQE